MWQRLLSKLSISVLLLFMASCTTNNGPHSDIYGMWKVEAIYINGEPEQMFSNYLFLQFQNDVVQVKGISTSIGRWEQHGDYSEIIMWFGLENQMPPQESHFVMYGANICKVEQLTSKKFVFTMKNSQSPDGYTYHMCKW